jgi:hypothetical protein
MMKFHLIFRKKSSKNTNPKFSTKKKKSNLTAEDAEVAKRNKNFSFFFSAFSATSAVKTSMEIVVGLLIAGMIIFAFWSALREIRLYRNYLEGNTEYLVSKQRRNRRVLISAILILEAVLLFLGFYILSFANPFQALFFWLPPLMLIVWLIYLVMKDFRETSHDIDVIFREASDVILKKKQEN